MTHQADPNNVATGGDVATLDEIKQRDASFVSEHLPEALDASHLSDEDGNDAVKDRRWLLAHVEALSAALGEVERKLSDQRVFCGGEFPCEASTSAASFERERNDLRAILDSDAMRYVVGHALNADDQPPVGRELTRALAKSIGEVLGYDTPSDTLASLTISSTK